jgi:hypothetical protein
VDRAAEIRTPAARIVSEQLLAERGVAEPQGSSANACFDSGCRRRVAIDKPTAQSKQINLYLN